MTDQTHATDDIKDEELADVIDPSHATYLTTEQLAARIHYDARTIRNKLNDSVLIEGVHYIRPFGGRKILYVWEAIARDMNKLWNTKSADVPLAGAGSTAVHVRVRNDCGQLMLDFRYNGQRCRELTALKDSKENRLRVHALANRIQRDLKNGTFDYASYFPKSPRVALDRKPDHSPEPPTAVVPPVTHLPAFHWNSDHLARLVAAIDCPESLAALAGELGVTVGEALGRYRRLLADVRTPPSSRTRIVFPNWSADEIQWIRDDYPDATTEQIQARFPYRRLTSIYAKASELGVKRNRVSTLPQAPHPAEPESKAASLVPQSAPQEPTDAHAPAEQPQPLLGSSSDAGFLPYGPWAPHEVAHMVYLRAMDLPFSLIVRAAKDFGRSQGDVQKLFLHLGISIHRATFMSQSQLARLSAAFQRGGLKAAVRALPHLHEAEVRSRLVAIGLLPDRSIAWRCYEIDYLRASIKRDRSVTEVACNLGISVESVHKAAEALMRGEEPQPARLRKKDLQDDS